MSFRPDNARLLDLQPFVVATPEAQAALDLAPFGLAIPPEVRFDPLSVAAAPLLALLSRLDALTFGPEGMPMPRWVFLDAAELPGAIVGMGMAAHRLPPRVRSLLGLADDVQGFVPLSMFIAIPTFERETWLGHNLASLAELFEGQALRGLGSLTKAVGLKVMRARFQIGVTQWRHPALRVHARLGPLELLSAWTPAHSDPASLTYRVEIDDRVLRHLARDPGGSVPRPPARFTIDSDDEPGLQALHARIEAGERLSVVSVPVALGAERQRVSIG